MKRALAACALLLGLPLSALACLWDRDTPASEALGMPEVVAVITGRFERNPPLFYEMRLGRVAAHLKSNPDDLAAYDDAAVACDRLGLGDEAIDWMSQKRTQLKPLDPDRPEVKEQWYRYHANLGTFLAHRWLRQGADRGKIHEVEAARDEIARALAINPDAHFGREKYQLQALDWIIDPPRASDLLGGNWLPNLLGWSPAPYVEPNDPKEADDAVRGLSGLIVLGNAWESVDVFNALDVALQNDTLGFSGDREGGRNTLAYLTWMRCRELIDEGKSSLLFDAPEGEKLKALIPKPDFVKAELLLNSTFSTLRAEADVWHAARTAFMLERLNQGRHPDTDPHFWDGYAETPAPPLPTSSVPETYQAWQKSRMRTALATTVAIVVGLIAASVVLGRWARSRQKHKPESWEQAFP